MTMERDAYQMMEKRLEREIKILDQMIQAELNQRQSMTNDEFKAIRRSLGLSITQLAELAGVRADYIRHMEMPPDKKSAIAITPPMARLMIAYSEGYRPKDWPK
jgi:DNA-binding transcriptional regulator YiaG